jgi:hypothetical protein
MGEGEPLARFRSFSVLWLNPAEGVAAFLKMPNSERFDKVRGVAHD